MSALYPYRIARCLLLLMTILAMTGCAAGYYWQAGTGQLRVSNGKQSVEALLEAGEISQAERERLLTSQRALSFAHGTLLLPDNGSYRDYYDTGANYVVWNVFAAPEFSLEPRKWCFPITGCISYRGYFKQEGAVDYAAKLAENGDDIFVGGVTAYSTLGRLRDPLLNTMLPMSEIEFVGLLFHELAHQRLYVKDDSAFNEGFATAVEREGERRWRQIYPQAMDVEQNFSDEQKQQVLDLLRATRDQLRSVYSSALMEADKRSAKAAVFDQLAQDYERLSDEWQRQGLSGRPYSGLFGEGLNNASMSAIATYDNYVPAFDVLLRQCAYAIECFYSHAEELAAMDKSQRDEQMRALVIQSQQPFPDAPGSEINDRSSMSSRE